MAETAEALRPGSRLSPLRAWLLIPLATIGVGGILAIFALLTAFAIFSLSGPVDLGKETQTQADLVGLKATLTAYKLKYHGLPTTEQGLNALVTRPTFGPVPPHWEQTLDSLIYDPWGNPYQYSNPGKHNLDSFDVYSMGPDGKPNTADDIGNWK